MGTTFSRADHSYFTVFGTAESRALPYAGGNRRDVHLRPDHRAIADPALAPTSNDFSASPGFSALIKVSPIRKAL